MKDDGAARRLVLAEFLPYRLVALGDALSRRLARAYAHEGVSIAEWRVLAVISQANAMAARDVVARTPLDKMAVSRAVASLERKQLIERSAAPGDKRVSMLRLSAAGRAVFSRIAAIALRFEQGLIDPMSDDEIGQLKALLGKLEDSAPRAEDAPR